MLRVSFASLKQIPFFDLSEGAGAAAAEEVVVGAADLVVETATEDGGFVVALGVVGACATRFW